MKVSVSHGHDHSWNRGTTRTSYDDGHSHKVSNPSSGWTDGAGMDNHKHRLPRFKVKAKT